MKASAPSARAIVFLGVVLGLAGNQLSPGGLALIAPAKGISKAGELIAPDQAKQLWGDGAALLMDAREPAEYAAGHTVNALNLPARSFERDFGAIAPMTSISLFKSS